jgi:hypothetical protein
MGAGIDGLQYYMDEEAVAMLGLDPDDMSAIMVEMVEAVQTITKDMSQT